MNELALQPALRELALFAGAGGGILGGKLLGWRTVCAVEINAYCRSVLLARQRDGILDPFPIWDDVRTFDGKPWRGHVDVISGGFPCQDISVAGKGAGITGARSGLWTQMARIIRDVKPRFVLVENSPALLGRGMGRVLRHLACLGYNASWGVLGAIDSGMDHRRKRVWIAAHSVRSGFPADMLETSGVTSGRKSSKKGFQQGRMLESARLARRRMDAGDEAGRAARAWQDAPCEPLLFGVPDGHAVRVDRIRAIGNSQVPAVVRLAWENLT